MEPEAVAASIVRLIGEDAQCVEICGCYACLRCGGCGCVHRDGCPEAANKSGWYSGHSTDPVIAGMQKFILEREQ